MIETGFELMGHSIAGKRTPVDGKRRTHATHGNGRRRCLGNASTTELGCNGMTKLDEGLQYSPGNLSDVSRSFEENEWREWVDWP